MSGVVRVAEPGDAPPLALLLHAFNAELGEPAPEPGGLARRLRGLLENGSAYLATGEREV